MILTAFTMSDDTSDHHLFFDPIRRVPDPSMPPPQRFVRKSRKKDFVSLDIIVHRRSPSPSPPAKRRLQTPECVAAAIGC
jgi:hypothetical protein